MSDRDLWRRAADGIQPPALVSSDIERAVWWGCVHGFQKYFSVSRSSRPDLLSAIAAFQHGYRLHLPTEGRYLRGLKVAASRILHGQLTWGARKSYSPSEWTPQRAFFFMQRAMRYSMISSLESSRYNVDLVDPALRPPARILLQFRLTLAEMEASEWLSRPGP